MIVGRCEGTVKELRGFCVGFEQNHGREMSEEEI
jgi:hypothetical protein